MATERRSFQADLEVRSDRRTVCGICVPFDVPAEIRGPAGKYAEVFTRGAFERTIAERADRVKFLAMHDHERLPVGRATLLREDSVGLYGEFHVSATGAGDEVLELVRDGALDGLSVGFRPIRDRWDETRSMVQRVEVALVEVSAVTWPAYDDARVVAVRDDRPVLPADEVLARLAPLLPKITFDDAYERLYTLTMRGES